MLPLPTVDAVVVRFCCLFDYISSLRHAMWELYLPRSPVVIAVVNIVNLKWSYCIIPMMNRKKKKDSNCEFILEMKQAHLHIVVFISDQFFEV